MVCLSLVETAGIHSHASGHNNASLMKKKKAFLFIAIGNLLTLTLAYSYVYTINNFKTPNARIFDMDTSPTWLAKGRVWKGPGEEIFRIYSQGDLDAMLLSNDRWEDFEFSFLIKNLYRCAVVFNYKDIENSQLIYLNARKAKIIWGTFIDGVFTVLKVTPVDITKPYPFILKTNRTLAQLFYNGQLISEVNTPSAGSGKVGFVMNTVYPKRTLFSGIEISGIKNDKGPASINQVSHRDINVPFPIMLLYLFTIGVGAFLYSLYGYLFRSVPFLSLIQKLAGSTFKTKIFVLFSAVVGVVVFTRCIQLLSEFRWRNFTNMDTWECLLVNLTCYLIILLLSLLYCRMFKLLSVPILFISLTFFFYFLSLLNLLSLRIDDTLFLRLCFLGLFIPIGYRAK